MSPAPQSRNLIGLASLSGMVALTIYLMVVGEGIFLPLVLAIFISYLVIALGHAIEGIKIGTWRPNSTVGLLLATLVFIMAITGVVQIIADNLREVANAAPQYQERLKQVLAQVSALIAKIFGKGKPLSMTTLLNQIDLGIVLTSFAGAFQTIAGNTFQIFAYVTFLLLESRHFDRKMQAMFPDKEREKTVRATMSQIGKRIETYVLVKTMISFLVGVASFVVLTVADVDFAPFWALLIFVLNFIPYIGSPMGMMFPTLMSLLKFGSIPSALITLAFLWGVQSTIENFLEPKLMGRSLNLSPVFMMLSLSVWGAIWGITGMILAVPIMVMTMIVLAQFPETRPVAVMMSETGEVR
ncbi:MAG: AI-2E family transporter [Rhodospirillaceae bacterium]|nr:AI-2E family transporter [Rhodospirillaceae bacterium]